MSTPVFSLLKNFEKNRISFAMPGHKNGRGLEKSLIDCDVTELPATLDLHDDGGAVGKACELLAQLYGSERSFISTCGSTACIQAMLAAVLKPGDTLLVSCDCHMSVINTCALCGFNMRYIPKTVNSEFLIPDKNTGIEELINKYKDIKAVMITSPTYYGICADIAETARICHKKNIPLLVDEAHGAHFPFSDRLPESAVRMGADAVCQSAHKTLNALTGAAFLHVSGNLIDSDRIKKTLFMFHTSSPSYVIAASADIALSDSDAAEKWNNVLTLCDKFKKQISENTKIKLPKNDDLARLVLNFSAYDISGYEVEKLLSEKYGIDVEMSDMKNIVLIVSAYNTARDFDTLYDALCIITEQLPQGKPFCPVPPPVCETLINPGKAFYSECSQTKLENAAGKISAAYVCAYPPGTPIISYGEKITEKQTEYIKYIKKTGAKIKGLDGDTIKTVN